MDYDPMSIVEAYAEPGEFSTFNLKPMVEDWLTGVLPNEGMLIAGPEVGSGADRWRLASSESANLDWRPKLEVVYTLATATPTATRTPTATPSATPTATSPGPTATPTQSLTPWPTGTSRHIYLPLIRK